MATPQSSKPGVLMIGKVHHAHKDFEELAKGCHLQHVKDGSRAKFISDCRSGVYDNVLAISRTYDSAQITGNFDAELISSLPNSIKFISHNGAGYDQIDVRACTHRGISVSNTPTAVDNATANTAILLILGALRRVWVPEAAIREGGWRGATTLGRDPDNLKLGILGMGGIGTATVKRALGFGFEVQYHNRTPVQGLSAIFGADEPKYVSFDELIRTSDVISVHLPLSAATRGLIGAKEIAAMKDGVIIVNTARGPIIDEDALVKGLESGKVWSVGLDVFEKEPKVHPGLIKSPNAVLLPHIGTATVDTQKRMEILVIDNVKSAITKGKLLTQVPEQASIAQPRL